MTRINALFWEGIDDDNSSSEDIGDVNSSSESEGENIDNNNNNNNNLHHHSNKVIEQQFLDEKNDKETLIEQQIIEEKEIAKISFGKRLQLVRIYDDPHIYTIDNFLNKKELHFFDNIIMDLESRQGFKKSYIDKSTNNHSFDDSRTSQFVHFGKCENKMISDIEKRASELVGMSIENIEPLQVVRYQVGQFFDDHHDLGVLFDDGSVELPKRSPRRVCTLFLYINDIPAENGGSTRFPLLENDGKDYLDIQPKRGMAVLWCNIRRDGTPDERLGELVCML